MKNNSKIKVFLVDDCWIDITLIEKLLQHPDFEIIGKASHGAEALKQLATLQPDIICTDIYMPVMNGVDFVKEIMATKPYPILIISVAGHDHNNQDLFAALEAGAIDIFPKPKLELYKDNSNIAQKLQQKIRLLSGVSVIRRSSKNFNTNNSQEHPFYHPLPINIIAMGASTGGPQLLEQLFQALPASYSIPIVCVQHMALGFLDTFLHWLDKQTALQVKIAQEGHIPKAGYIYFPPSDKHLIINKQGYFQYSNESPFEGHRPSVNQLFSSIAEYYQQNVLGILLTGMGSDGALGLKTIKQKGGVTITQDKSSSVVFGMPSVAIELGASKYTYSAEKIKQILIKFSE